MTKKPGTLLLLPNLLGDLTHHQLFLPQSIEKAVHTLHGLIAESERGGRRFLGRFLPVQEALQVPLALFNEHTPDQDVDFLLEPLGKGQRWGLISDAGLPCVADPGHLLVRRARQLGMQVKAFIGPSSLLLALMLSGLPGQRFTFRGYLPKDPKQRVQEIKKLEQASAAAKASQLFIEAPYRNRHTLQALLDTLEEKSWLCVAWDLTLPTQGVVSQPIKHWHKQPLPTIEKKPAIFIVYAGL